MTLYFHLVFFMLQFSIFLVTFDSMTHHLRSPSALRSHTWACVSGLRNRRPGSAPPGCRRCWRCSRSRPEEQSGSLDKTRTGPESVPPEPKTKPDASTFNSDQALTQNRRTTELQNRGTTEPQNRRTMEPRNRRTTEPWNRRTTEPQNHGIAEPWKRRTMELRNCRIMETQNHGTTEPGGNGEGGQEIDVLEGEEEQLFIPVLYLDKRLLNSIIIIIIIII